jgi:hypothetical protein
MSRYPVVRAGRYCSPTRRGFSGSQGLVFAGGRRVMNAFKTFTLVLLASVTTSTGVQAFPYFAPVFGMPVAGIGFNTPGFDVSVSSETLLEPTVIETVRGGGVVESNLNAYTDSLHGYASLDLTGPGFAGISMLAKIRTTVITRTAPEFPPLAPDLIIGANTAVSLHELRDLGDVRYTLSYNLSITAFPGEGDFNVANRGGLLGCTQTEDTVCSTFLDYDTAETSFRLTPEQPIVYDTFLRYAVTLETLAVAVDEPASASLIILPLALIGLPAIARRRLKLQGEEKC